MADDTTDAAPLVPDVMTLDPTTIDNAVLRRLIAEVLMERTVPVLYDRIHNRHNRALGGREP